GGAVIGLGLALAALGGAACDKQSSCRPGTIFVQVDVAPFITANEVGIDVSVDGSTPVHTDLRFPTGTRAGGVEVKFPNGYPAGKKVALTLSLSAGAGSILATRSMQIVLTGDCAAITVDFAADGGMGGGGGASAGAGGHGGGGGGGAGGSLGGNTGGGGGSAGGTGGGSAGAGGGTGGTGGAAGRGGAGGSAGTGGSAGAGGGAAGRGGAGGGAGRGGAGGGCVATGAENCFNNLDDDCDGKIDCADSDCTPNVAQCVALDPTGGGKIGFFTAATAACPQGYSDQTVINKGLTGGACAGCSCKVPMVTACSATIASYKTAADCGTASNQGTAEITFSSTQACTTPNWVGSSFGTIYGVQAGPFTPTLSAACTPSGTPAPGPVAWGASNRFCATTTMGGGCQTGQVCVPVNTAVKCAIFDGAHSCQAGTSADAWYTGSTDARTCGACACGGATGQSCAGMTLDVGTDYSCGTITAMLASGQRFCYPASGTGVYSPGLIFTGTPTQPTSCPASAPLSGALTATGPKTVCCLP
ncbi:MAG TPA: hypothetical protein VIF57_26710, partial [Polyangia bacterium]